MELHIGTNIKRLRLGKGLTQEQLAELLSVSSAAVSKWEAKSTYPDITLLFPLAQIFGVTIDELLGYDEEMAQADVDRMLTEYRELSTEGRHNERTALMEEARKKYPHDYRIMVRYMWDKAGGNTTLPAEQLLQYKDEFYEICDCILSGCTVDSLRADAIHMKAKLLHAQGKTEEALQLLTMLPAWHAPFMKEQLFEKGTEEYRTWNKRNYIGLLDVMAIKAARTVRYEPSLSVKEKTAQLEAIAQAFAEMAEKPNLTHFCVGEQAVYAVIAGMLSPDNAPIEDVIRVREKQFASMEKMTRLAEKDALMKEMIEKTYRTNNCVSWTVDRLMNTPHPQFAKFRDDPKYMEMLHRWKQKA